MPISKRLDHPERRANSGVSSVHRQPERTYRRDRISALFYCLNRREVKRHGKEVICSLSCAAIWRNDLQHRRSNGTSGKIERRTARILRGAW